MAGLQRHDVLKRLAQGYVVCHSHITGRLWIDDHIGSRPFRFLTGDRETIDPKALATPEWLAAYIDRSDHDPTTAMSRYWCSARKRDEISNR